MRHISSLLISSLLTFTMGSAYAADKNPTQTPVAKPGAVAADPTTTVAAAQKKITPASATITVYENPATTSKVLANLPQQQALITIFKQGDWVKVANPQNGMVGWVLKTSLGNATTVTVTQQSPGAQEYVITQKNQDGSAGSVYRVIQYTNTNAAPNQLTAEQIKAVFDNVKLQQQKMQADFNRMFNDAFRNMGQITPSGTFQSFPVMPPVIIIQQQPTNTATKK